VRELRKLDVTTIVDTDGEPLRQAVRAEPTLISPNVNEAEELVGHEFNDDDDMLHGIQEMSRIGAREAIMTTPDGCFASLRGEAGPLFMRARIEPREPVATVGSGDAFLAGFVAARYEERSPAECLRFAVACGAESTQRLGAGSSSRARSTASSTRSMWRRSQRAPRPDRDRGFVSENPGRSGIRRW
jgi:1-phosphofructokinase/tagatose 6-phosphate kinase